MNQKQKLVIKNILRESLRAKFRTHNPEPAYMPFHTRLLGKDRLALYSFIHSLNTNFGTTIFEPVAVALARENGFIAERQAIAGNLISSEAEKVIGDIMRNLITSETRPIKLEEIEKIRKVAQVGIMNKIKPTKVDLKLLNRDGSVFLFDIKAAKPNMGEFKGFKQTLLQWIAVVLAENIETNVNSMIAIPYNPYEPEPYNRWTMAGLLDLEHELKVAKEFWDFIGSKGAYEELLDCFEEIGVELKDEIDEYFKRYIL